MQDLKTHANGGPPEFSRAYIEQNSPIEEQLYTAFLRSGEPFRSMNRPNFHVSAKCGLAHDPNTALNLEDDELSYNTSGRTAACWRDKSLPRPARDIHKLRADLCEWGYCLIEEALAPAQLATMKQRVADQAAGERKAGLASWMGTAPAPGEKLPRIQFVHSVINKGAKFIRSVEHDPEGVQAGLVIEQLLNETMGSDFLMSSFLAIIPNPLNSPQGLHQDQATAPFQGSTAPFTGRLLHGTGVNRSDRSRTILVMNSVKPFMRQQELHMLSVFPHILKNSSPKLLYRLGARPTGLGGIEGMWNGEYLVNQRLAMEGGRYLRVGELGPDTPADVLNLDYGVRYSETMRYQAPHQPETAPNIKALYADARPVWCAPEEPKFPPRKT